ncbi:MAG: hypothetical protein WDM89_07460 [Rhizomicrobium sp.]
MAEVQAEGPGAKMIVFGATRNRRVSASGYFGIIVKSVTIDAWVVIAILGIMAVISCT